MTSVNHNKRKHLDEVGSLFNSRYGNNKKFHGELTFNEKIVKLGDNIKKTLKPNEEQANPANRRTSDLISADLDREIDRELQNEQTSNSFIELVCKCCVAFPSKVGAYSTLIGLINAKNYNACATLIETLCSSYSSYLQAQKWSEALTIVHIFSNLVCCQTISYTSLLSFFEILLEATIEDNTTQARSDYYAYTVLSSLMYVGQELSSKSKTSELEQIMNTVSNHIKKRQHTHLNALRVWLSDDLIPQMDYIDSLWAQVSKLKEAKWTENFICRPYNDYVAKFVDCNPHNLHPIQVPVDYPTIFYPYPRVIFRLFDEDAIEDENPLPASDSIVRFYMEHQLSCLISECGSEKKSCAGYLFSIYGHDVVPIEYILVEFLIGELLTLPLPNKCDVLYSSLVLDLCGFSSVKFTAALAKSIQILYDNLDTMNVTCIDRFVNWFAFHLNNYDFLWSWQQWQDSLSEEDLHPKPVFVRELISKCIRLSFYTKTVALFKDSLAPLIPTEPAIRDKYLSDQDIAGHDLALELKKMIMEKKELPAYNSVLNIRLGDSVDDIDIDEKPAHHLLKIDVFTNVLLNLASKSFTHLFSAIGKFQSVFKALMKGDDSKMQLLKSIHYTWKTHPQLQVVLVDKLLKINLIDVCVVCDWIFTAEMSLESMKFYTWEILNNTISRQCKRRDAIMKKLENVKDSESTVQDVIVGLEEQLQSLNAIEEKMFCIVLERFTKLLSKHIHECKSQGGDFKDYWFRWMIGHMQQVFFIHNKYIFPHVETIESLIFSSDILDTHILLIFRQFLSLRS